MRITKISLRSVAVLLSLLATLAIVFLGCGLYFHSPELNLRFFIGIVAGVGWYATDRLFKHQNEVVWRKLVISHLTALAIIIVFACACTLPNLSIAPSWQKELWLSLLTAMFACATSAKFEKAICRVEQFIERSQGANNKHWVRGIIAHFVVLLALPLLSIFLSKDFSLKRIVPTETTMVSLLVAVLLSTAHMVDQPPEHLSWWQSIWKHLLKVLLAYSVVAVTFLPDIKPVSNDGTWASGHQIGFLIGAMGCIALLKLHKEFWSIVRPERKLAD